MSETDVVLSDAEMSRLKAYADANGLSVEEAAQRLAKEGMRNRFGKRTGKRPSPSVRRRH